MANKWKRLQRRRAELAEKQKGLCHWCGVVMTPPVRPGEVVPTALTLDHLYSRLHPLRQVWTKGERYVAACWGCNNRRGLAECQHIPARVRFYRWDKNWDLCDRFFG